TLHAGSLTGISWFPEVGDFDGDGDPDVVIGHALPGLISFFENVTTPGGPPAFLAPQSFPASEFTRFLRTVDLDLDGDLDLLAADFTGDRLVILRNNRLGGASPRSPDQPTPALRDPASVVPPELRTDGVALAKWLSDLDGDPTRIVLDPGDDPVTGAPR
ncbi:MAG: FG-GAP-like repeat-containing protein, partial [Planctomycetota bacterium]|nr:FG-GAP-like repeat-containing protein [Planctomycetota bacterium]